VTGFDNYALNSISTKSLGERIRAGKVLVPCGAEEAIAASLEIDPSGWARCRTVTSLTAAITAKSTLLGLLPPALVGPSVKVVPLNGADLFGEAPQRSLPYPLRIVTPTTWQTSWVAYDANDVRVLLTTGVNCPDRGVSRETDVLGKGWPWLLDAGTAKYTGRHWDPAFGWYVVDAVRTGNLGAIKSLIQNADIAESDFECPMTSSFVYHPSGTTFTIDPKVAALMKQAGFDIVTLGSDHMTNAGLGGVTQTVRFFDQQGIKHVGAGTTLAAALRPVVIDVRGLKFGFVGFNGAGGSVAATSSSPGTAPMTSANIRNAIAAARKVSDIVIALPQWSTREYVAAWTSQQLAWRNEMFAAGADHIIGADNHWAAGLSITPGGVSGNHLAVDSQGNFWFGQDWSRQTEEGVMTMTTFIGTRLAQVRLIPTVVLDDAQPNLTDPATDGQFVLQQVLGASILQAR
jgi:poly-gamma-glutamate capsule biosynthesis protein CapA/YwtB (metallophosphatase superfamily)